MRRRTLLVVLAGLAVAAPVILRPSSLRDRLTAENGRAEDSRP
jgi:hypothetical protein